MKWFLANFIMVIGATVIAAFTQKIFLINDFMMPIAFLGILPLQIWPLFFGVKLLDEKKVGAAFINPWRQRTRYFYYGICWECCVAY